VLDEVPESRLIIKSGGLSSPRALEHLRELARLEGLDDDRLELVDRMESKADHLTAYGRLDIALDTFPYHGTTTTCEALWQGVPVVSLVGDRHASRVGLSLLTAAGFPELAAATPDEFVRTAAALAGDPARLARLRESLRPTMQASALCNAAAFSARFHEALRAVWREHCRV
jgi:predicted O-linked N-acetylglucosamine transferase (SPINDLY family)